MMDTSSYDNIRMENYANAYISFYRALEVLASSPEEQCEYNDWENVAWQVRFEMIVTADNILNSSSGLINQVKIDNIKSMLEEISTLITDDIINSLEDRKSQLKSMSAPIWDYFRERARFNLQALKEETDIVKEYLRL